MPAIVNVLGLRHSGTTMLHLMLANGDRAVACGEVSGWFRLGRYVRGAAPPSVVEPLGSVRPADFHAKALNHFSADHIIDWSKSLSWVLDVNHWASRRGLRVYNILVWKDPVQQAYSNWKRGQEWQPTYVKYHRNLLRSGLEMVSIRYERLVEDPSTALKKICEHIEMPYFDGKENFWENQVELAGSNAGGVRRQLQRGTSRLRLEQHAPEFAEYARDVEEQMLVDRRLVNVVRGLDSLDVAAQHPHPHGHRVTVLHLLERYVTKWPRVYYLRLRWHVLEPIRRRIKKPAERRKRASFDPDRSDAI